VILSADVAEYYVSSGLVVMVTSIQRLVSVPVGRGSVENKAGTETEEGEDNRQHFSIRALCTMLFYEEQE